MPVPADAGTAATRAAFPARIRQTRSGAVVQKMRKTVKLSLLSICLIWPASYVLTGAGTSIPARQPQAAANSNLGSEVQSRAEARPLQLGSEEREKLLALGKKIFVERCARCHDERGDKALKTGQPLSERSLSDEEIARAVSGRLKGEPEER